MLNTCVTSIFKMYGIKADEVDEEEIGAFVSKNFPEDAELDCAAL